MIITLQNNDVTYKSTSYITYSHNITLNNNIILQTMKIHNKTMIITLQRT